MSSPQDRILVPLRGCFENFQRAPPSSLYLGGKLGGNPILTCGCFCLGSLIHHKPFWTDVWRDYCRRQGTVKNYSLLPLLNLTHHRGLKESFLYLVALFEISFCHWGSFITLKLSMASHDEGPCRHICLRVRQMDAGKFSVRQVTWQFNMADGANVFRLQ